MAYAIPTLFYTLRFENKHPPGYGYNSPARTIDRYNTSLRTGVPSPLSSHPNPPNTLPAPVPSSGSSSVGGERGRFIRSWAV